MQSRGERDSKKEKKRNDECKCRKKTLKENVYISSTIHYFFEFINLISYAYKHYENDFLQYSASSILLHFSEDIHQSLHYKDLSCHDAVLITSCRLKNTF